jgi:uncharacterized protein (TIGR00295 family)
MNKIPTEEECLTLLHEAGCKKEVIRHSKAVYQVAIKIAQKTNADLNLVKAGALLHDIGRSKTNGIRHAVEGAKIAKKLGLASALVKVIECHLGAGLSKDIASSLGLPRKDYMPTTLEEKIVCHADNLIDDWSRQPIEKEVERALSEGNKHYALQLIKLHKELSDLCGMDLNNI